MDKLTILKNFGLGTIGLLCIPACNNQTKLANNSPNIIYILADDLGYGDISSYNPNCAFKTPNIDRLASEGVRFSDAHSGSSVCTPTRYSILTGRYAWRSSLANGVLWSYDKHLIKPERTTVASLLKKQGYNTACIGKWHLGLDWTRDTLTNEVDFSAGIQNGPNVYGFDYFYGITASLDIPPYVYLENTHITALPDSIIPANGGKGFWRQGHLGSDFNHEEVLQNLTNKTVTYIKNQNKDKPFFVYFPLPAPHTPILPTEKFLGKSNTNEYGDFVLQLDDVLGQIMAVLKEKEMEDNTLVIFTSDNGCSPMADFKELESFGHNPSYIFRGAKADIYEGGHRIPFIAKWPAKIPKGIVSDQTICLSDLLATCSAITEYEMDDQTAEDSYNILPALMDEKYEGKIREATVHHSINGSFAIRKGKWKLIFCSGSGGWSYPTPSEIKSLNLPPVQLFNIEIDPGEQNNLNADYPDIVIDLTELMKKYIENGRSTPGEIQENDRVVTLLPIN